MIRRLFTTSALVCLLAWMGCDYESNTLTSALGNEGVDASDDGAGVTNKFFTGRDSFGVAFKVQLEGEAVITSDGRCDDETVILSGSGNATHLGRIIEGMLTHCIEEGDFSTVSDGQFSFRGSNGGEIVGEYKPLPSVSKNGKSRGDVFETKADITGGEIAAVKRDEVEGRGDLRIVMEPNGTFTQTFDGWLLHHLGRHSEED